MPANDMAVRPCDKAKHQRALLPLAQVRLDV